MNAHQLVDHFSNYFDVVGVIRTSTYQAAANSMNKAPLEIPYPTMVVVGLAYPRRNLSHPKTHVVASFYTFGQDYHTVLTNRFREALSKFTFQYSIGVDNHPLDERLAATLAGIGFFGKNQLIINPHYGSYMFLGVAFIDVELNNEFRLIIDDSCGTCTKCITACPVDALSENGYDMTKCISHYNQAKQPLTAEQKAANYCLFGCDICQMVCPKNMGKVNPTHIEFELTGKEAVALTDLFTLSANQFDAKYGGMAYLWKGKTILMRNALTLVDEVTRTSLVAQLPTNLPKWFTT